MRASGRLELKYLVTWRQYASFRKEITPFCHYDPYSGNGSYTVNSLYFDSPRRAFYHQTLESEERRKKVRVRCYDSIPSTDSSFFFEVKEKNSSTILKRRVAIPSARGLSFVSTKGPLRFKKEELEEGVLEELAYLAHRFDLRPSVWVKYRRRAWLHRFQPHSLRVTVDTDLTAKGPAEAFLESRREQAILNPLRAIIEIKTSQGFPLWLTRAIQRCELVQTKASKYSMAIEKLH